MRKSFYDDKAQNKILSEMCEAFGDNVASRPTILDFCAARGLKVPYFIFNDPSRKVSRGKFSIAPDIKSSKKHATSEVVENVEEVALSAQVVHITPKKVINQVESLVPDKDPTYVPFGFFNDLELIIKSNFFHPVYITGLSGNGKTMMVEQVCAKLRREMVRTNITKRTDETDLIGNYNLIDGNTVRIEGPVVTAMRRGAILLLDETDLGTEDLLCLQSILEGKPYLDKKTGEVIKPKPGFNIVATANTKGRGMEGDGAAARFVGTNLLNEAFLERFAITEEQEYPPVSVEKKILNKNMSSLGLVDPDCAVFVEKLVSWADITRKSHYEGVTEEIISTRRLVHIVKNYAIFRDKMKAIKMALNRFDAETKNSFLDLYTKIDATVTLEGNVSA